MDGYFYGAARVNDSGTIFRVAMDGAFQTLHTFSGQDGMFATRLRRAPDDTILASVIDDFLTVLNAP